MDQKTKDHIDSLCRSAGSFPVRRSDAALYKLLAECLNLVNQCYLDPGLLQEVKDLAITYQKDRGAKRTYFESTADPELVVGRLVFGGEKRRDACWRYTAAMREANKRQISSENLVSWLTENGGINSLFRSRPVTKRTRETKTLFLREAVRLPKSGLFTLVLEDDGSGFYHVISLNPQEGGSSDEHTQHSQHTQHPKHL